MARNRPKDTLIIPDRVLIAALCFGSAGYLVMRSWEGVALLVAAYTMGVVWAFRTAGNDRRRALRLLALVLLVMLGSFLTVYIATREGVIF